MRVAALLCLALAAPSCGFAAAGGKGGAKKKKPAAGGGGFGATANKEPKLDAKAAKILKQVGGNVDAAQEQHFQSALRRLEKKDPELFTVLMEAEGGLPTGDAHKKLVELFWDAVAVYMPARKRDTDSTKMGAEMRSKIESIATLSTASGPAVLDVGCGDGAMLPHLLKAGAEQGQYLGIDIASTMIDRAEMAHPKAMFKRAEFLNLDPMSEAYDGVLLNGVSQFFEDDLVLIDRATKWLKPGGLVVVSHAQGAKFVADEHDGNRAVARSLLPSPERLNEIADALRMEVLTAEECVPDNSAHTLEGDDFYLVALRLLPRESVL